MNCQSPAPFGGRCAATLVCIAALLAAVSACKSPAPLPTGAAAAPSPSGPSGLQAVAAPAELTITFAMPRGDVQSAAMGAVAFNQPMVALTAVDQPAEVTQIRLEPAVTLTARWLGTSTLGFWPAAPLKGSTRYQVKVSAFQSLGGQKSQPTQWQFATPTATVTAAIPSDGAREVHTNAVLAVRYDQPVDAQSVAEHAHLESGKLAMPKLLAHLPSKDELAKLQGDNSQGNLPWLRRTAGTRKLDDDDLPRWVVLQPAAPLPPDAQVALIIAPGVRSLEGPELTRAPHRVSFSTLGPLQIVSAGCDGKAECDPDSWAPIRVQFNNQLASEYSPWDDAARAERAKQLAKFFKVTPALPGMTVACYGMNCSVHTSGDAPTTVARWQPGASYTLEVLPGLADAHGQKLQTGLQTVIKMGHRAPNLELMSDGSVFERHEGPHRIAVALRNAPAVEVKAAKVAMADIGKALTFVASGVADVVPHGARPPKNPTEFQLPVALQLRGTKVQDADERAVLEVDTALGGNGNAGVVVLRARGPVVDGKPLEERKIYRVTDLHILAKPARGTALFWVTSLKTGQPVSGAEVQVQQRDGTVVWKGATNAEGLATGPLGLLKPQPKDDGERGDEEMGDDDNLSAGPHYLVFASRGDDWTFEEINDYGDSDGAWRFHGSDEAVRGVLFSDKTLYKRGETVHFKGIVRTIGAAGVTMPAAGEKVAVHLRDPARRPLGSVELKLSSNGTFDGQLALPAEGAYGEHNLRAEVAGIVLETALEVRTYRTPKFRMEAHAGSPHYVKGDRIGLDVSAGYYAGGPLDNAPADLNASGYADDFAPPGWPNFIFGGGETYQPGVANSFESKQSGRLDAQGRGHFEVDTAASTATRSIPLKLEATAQDPNGQPVSHTAEAWLHPAAVHAGLKLDKLFIHEGEALTVQLVAPDAYGKPVAGAKIGLNVQRREYLQVREVGIGGTLQWRTETKLTDVGGCQHAAGAAPVQCAVILPAAGYYVVSAMATDSKGRVSRAQTDAFAYGKAVANWDVGEHRELVTADQERYKVGDKAKLLIRNGFSGKTALVTEERDGVLLTRMVKLEGEAPLIEVPVEDRHAPNFYVGVAVFTGRTAPAEVGKDDLGAPQIEIGYVKVSVDVADRQLKLAVKTDQEQYLPQQDVQVAMQLTDAAGKPAAGEVVLWAVDEGVLALSGQKRPELLPTLYGEVSLGVRNFAMVRDLIKGKVAEDKGADGGGGASLRGDFRDVPVWLPNLQAGADGKVAATFKVPDNLTAFRLMAVAVSGPGKAGGGEATIRVDKPVSLLTTFPKQVHVGDVFEVAATLRNRTGGPLQGNATLVIEAQDGAASLIGAPSQAVSIGKDQSKELAFRARATKAGQFKLQVRVDGGQAADGVQETVTVVDPMPTESVATWGQTAASVQEAVSKAAAGRAGVGGLQITAASTALAGLQGSLDWLMGYPYGCTEQLASQLQAFLWTERLAAHYAVADETRKKGRLRAQEAVDKILANRVPAGNALTLWPGTDSADIHATAWALRQLLEAKQAGLRVDEAFLKDSPAWLRQRLASNDPDPEKPARPEPTGFHAERRMPADEIADVDDAERCHIVAVLALAGQPAAGEFDTLFGRRNTLTLDDRLFLAEAAAVMGGPYTDKAKLLIDEATRSPHVDAATAHVGEDPSDPWRWYSAVRSNALLLNAIVRAQPDHPLGPRIARWLLEQRKDDRWGSTQDNAWALRGLGAWMQGQDVTGAAQQVSVLLGGKPVGSGQLQPKSLQTLSFAVNETELPAGTAPLVLQTAGGGILHYSVRYTYSLQADAETAKNAGFFVQRIAYDEKGAKNPLSVKRGDNLAVAVVVMADRRRRDVAVVDQLPAGLEPLDGELRTTSLATLEQLAQMRRKLLGEQLDKDGQARNFAGEGADRTELAGREVRWFLNEIEPGVHVFAYGARAAVRGQFLGRGARAECMYAPEVFGTGGPNRLTIE